MTIPKGLHPDTTLTGLISLPRITQGRPQKHGQPWALRLIPFGDASQLTIIQVGSYFCGSAFCILHLSFFPPRSPSEHRRDGSGIPPFRGSITIDEIPDVTLLLRFYIRHSSFYIRLSSPLDPPRTSAEMALATPHPLRMVASPNGMDLYSSQNAFPKTEEGVYEQSAQTGKAVA